uniref:ARG and Rhodanese-Phosphatase-superfamily-associated domain-containing protein n=1 Tax=candidate division WOR-3 bacterium TaxID=2052148 RepID=A0A7V3RH71_UNCW3
MDELELKINEPIFMRNLVIYPITDGSDDEGFNPATIDDALENKKGTFRELDIPNVNEIIFDNNGNLPVLMIDGEEVTGSLQNRIIARSSIVEAHSSSNIPVICAEERRWEEIGGFKTGYCSYPKIRSILAISLHKKIDTQHEVWKEIERKLTVTRTKSKTSSMHEIFDNLEDEIKRYLEGFEGLNHNTIGFIGTAGNRILGFDLFSNHHIYNKFEEKLLRSYVLDAMEYQRAQGAKPDIEGFFKNILKTVGNLQMNGQKGNVKLKGRGFVGQMAVYNKEPVHISAFPV